MIHTTVTPLNTKVYLEVPIEYIGKQIEVLLYTRESEREIKPVKKREKPSSYGGTLSVKKGDELLKYIEKSRNEWERNI